MALSTDEIIELKRRAKMSGRDGFVARQQLEAAGGAVAEQTAQFAEERKKLEELKATGADARSEIKRDLEEGRKFGKSIVADGSLGRVDKKVEEKRSGDIQDVIDRRRAALKGFDDSEISARRAEAKGQIDKQTETARRRLQSIQGQTGVRGGAAGAGISNILEQGLQTRADFERDLFLANVQQKRDALNSFETSVTTAESVEASRRAANIELDKFNLQQQANEKFAQQSTALGFAQLGVADRSADKSSAAAIEAAKHAGGGGGGKK